MRGMAVNLVLVAVCCVGCGSTKAPSNIPVNVALGDTEPQVVGKMRALGAKDVTKDTRYELGTDLTGSQKTFWWLLPDDSVAGILLCGDRVVYIEIGEPRQGVAGIAHWESQKRKTITSIPDKGAHAKP